MQDLELTKSDSDGSTVPWSCEKMSARRGKLAAQRKELEHRPRWSEATTNDPEQQGSKQILPGNTGPLNYYNAEENETELVGLAKHSRAFAAGLTKLSTASAPTLDQVARVHLRRHQAKYPILAAF